MKYGRRMPVFTQLMLWVLVIALGTAWIPAQSHAMLAPAPSATQESGDRAQDVQKVQRVLENKMIQQRLEDLGFTTDEVNSRMNSLSDAQVHQMAAQLDALMPGGQLTTIAIVLIVVALIILLVVLI